MAISSALEWICDVTRDMGTIRIKRMFGGAGLFCDNLMFGLEADGGIFFKADDVNRPDFEAVGSQPFSYLSKARRVSLSYWRIPEMLVDDEEEMRIWALRAFEAAKRAAAKKSSQ